MAFAFALPVDAVGTVARAEDPSPTCEFVHGHGFDGKGFVDRTMDSVLPVP